ncbi:hypothetical protein M758_UG303700 [Ceratodon purpureus]|nr:hypothetical protein M758_UG303700 [Ceratodon purpureus]
MALGETLRVDEEICRDSSSSKLPRCSKVTAGIRPTNSLTLYSTHLSVQFEQVHLSLRKALPKGPDSIVPYLSHRFALLALLPYPMQEYCLYIGSQCYRCLPSLPLSGDPSKLPHPLSQPPPLFVHHHAEYSSSAQVAASVPQQNRTVDIPPEMDSRRYALPLAINYPPRLV